MARSRNSRAARAGSGRSDVGRAGVASMTIRGAMAGVPPAWRRVTSAIVLVPLFVWVTTSAAPWTFQALVVAASLLACRELARMFERTGRPIHTRLCGGVSTALTAILATTLYVWLPTPEMLLAVCWLLSFSRPRR